MRSGSSGSARFAVASKDGTFVDLHFGHADRFLIYEAHAEGVTFLESRPVSAYCSGDCAPADRLEALVGRMRDCSFLLCRRIGYSPAHSLTAAGITPIEAHGPITSLIEAVFSGAGENVLYRRAWLCDPLSPAGHS